MADISEIKEKSWNLGKQRIDVIRSLAEKSLCCKNSVEEAARKLRLCKRHIYNLIKKFRESVLWPRALEMPATKIITNLI